jgi:tetratricopeptide (TPR) repeat protein
MLSNFAKVGLKDSIVFYVKKLETIQADNSADLRDIADAFLDIPDYNHAVSYYIKSIALKPTTIAYNNLGLAYENLQNWDNAKKYYLAALQINPDYAISIRNVALLYSKAGQYDSAVYFFRKRYNADPNNMSSLSFMLNAFAKLQLTDSIMVYANKLESLTTNNPSDIREIADAFLDIGYYDKAISLYFKALAIKPSTDIYNNLAFTYETAGKFDEAKKYYKLAVALQSSYTIALV